MSSLGLVSCVPPPPLLSLFDGHLPANPRAVPNLWVSTAVLKGCLAASKILAGGKLQHLQSLVVFMLAIAVSLP